MNLIHDPYQIDSIGHVCSFKYVDNMPSLCSTLYESRLYQAMCTTAFFAFLRVGEITICPRSPFVLQIEQPVKLEDQTGGILGLKITFRDFKHSYNKGDVSLTLSRRSDICPVQICSIIYSYEAFQTAHCSLRLMVQQFHVIPLPKFCP